MYMLGRLLALLLLIGVFPLYSWGIVTAQCNIYDYDAIEYHVVDKNNNSLVQELDYDCSSNLRYCCSKSLGGDLHEKAQIGSFFDLDGMFVAAKGPIQHTKHSLNQKINREVRSIDELNAVKNPLKKTDVKFDSQGRPSQKFIGEKASVAVNPKTGKVVTVHPTGSKLAERLKRQQGGEQ